MTDWLPDSNIRLRSSEPAHPMFAPATAAVRKITARGDGVHLMPQVVTEYWRVVTSPGNAHGGFGWTPAMADAEIKRLLFRAELPVLTAGAVLRICIGVVRCRHPLGRCGLGALAETGKTLSRDAARRDAGSWGGSGSEAGAVMKPRGPFEGEAGLRIRVASLVLFFCLAVAFGLAGDRGHAAYFAGFWIIGLTETARSRLRG